MLLYLTLDEYLAQWLIHTSESVPVRFPKGSVENRLLSVFLTKPPRDSAPDMPGPGKVPIELPVIKGLNPLSNYHLPNHARHQLVEMIRNRFDVQLFDDLHQFDNYGQRLDNLIYAWMENHGIDNTERNWNAIAKTYQRLRSKHRKKELNKVYYKSKKTG